MANTQATIYIESFDQTEDLGTRGLVSYRADKAAPATDVVLRVNVPVVNARAAFKFLSRGTNTLEETAIARYMTQFDRIYSFVTQNDSTERHSSEGSYERASIIPQFPFLPVESGGTDFSSGNVDNQEFSVEDDVNRWKYDSINENDLKEYMYYLETSAPGARLDFVQQLAKEVFGSINAVDLFSNEDDIYRSYEQAILKCGWKVNNFQTAQLQLARDQVNSTSAALAGYPVTTHCKGCTNGEFILEDPGHVFYLAGDTNDTNDDDTNYTDHEIENVNKLFYGCRARKRFGYGAKFKVTIGNDLCTDIEILNPGAGYAAGDVIEFSIVDLTGRSAGFDAAMWGNYMKKTDGTSLDDTTFTGSFKILISQTSLPYVNGNIVGIFNKRDKFGVSTDPVRVAYTNANATDTVNENPYNVTGNLSANATEFVGNLDHKTNSAIGASYLGWAMNNSTTIWKNKDSDAALDLVNLSGYELLQKLGLGAGEVIDYEDDTNDSNLFLYPIYYNYFAPEDIQALKDEMTMENVHNKLAKPATQNGLQTDTYAAAKYTTGSQVAGNVNTFLYTKYLYNPNGMIKGGTFLVSDNGNTTANQSGSGAVFEITFQKITDGTNDGPTYIKSIIVKSSGTGYVVGDMIRFPGTSFMLNTDTNLTNNYPASAAGDPSDTNGAASAKDIATSDDVYLIIGALDLPYVNLRSQEIANFPDTGKDFALTAMDGAKGAQDILTGLLNQVRSRFNLPQYASYSGSTTSGTYTDLTGVVTRGNVALDGSTSEKTFSGVGATFEVAFNDSNGPDGNPLADTTADTNGITNIFVKTPGNGYRTGDIIKITGSSQATSAQQFNGEITITVEDWLTGMLNAPFARDGTNDMPAWVNDDTNDPDKGLQKYNTFTWEKEVTAQLHHGSIGSLTQKTNRVLNGSTVPVTDCRVYVRSVNGVITIELAKPGKNWHPVATNVGGDAYLVIKGSEISQLTDSTKAAGSNIVPEGADGDDDIYILLTEHDYIFINGLNFVSQPLYAGDKLQMIFTVLSNKDQTDASGDLIAVSRTALVELFLTGDDHLFGGSGLPLTSGETQYLMTSKAGVTYDTRDVTTASNYRMAHIGYDSSAPEVTVFTDYPPLNRPGTDTNDSNDPYSSTFDATTSTRGAVP